MELTLLADVTGAIESIPNLPNWLKNLKIKTGSKIMWLSNDPGKLDIWLLIEPTNTYSLTFNFSQLEEEVQKKTGGFQVYGRPYLRPAIKVTLRLNEGPQITPAFITGINAGAAATIETFKNFELTNYTTYEIRLENSGNKLLAANYTGIAYQLPNMKIPVENFLKSNNINNAFFKDIEIGTKVTVALRALEFQHPLSSAENYFQRSPEPEPLHRLSAPDLSLVEKSRKVLELVNQALYFEPNNLNYKLLQSVTLSRSGRYTEGTQSASELLALPYKSSDAEALGVRAYAWFMINDYDSARLEAHKALSINPNQTIAISALSQIAIGEEDYEMALQLANNTLFLNPSDALACRIKGQALYESNNYNAALQALNASLQLDPMPYTYYVRCLVNSSLGDRDQSLKDIQLVVDNYPEDNSYRGRHIAACMDMEYYREAMDSANIYLTKDPNDAGTLVMRGYALYYLGAYQEAREDAYRVLEINPNDERAQDLIKSLSQKR